MIIYLVKSSWGSYDDYMIRNQKAFKDSGDASRFSAEYEAYIRGFTKDCPVSTQSALRLEHEHQIYEDWRDRNDFNGCIIEEVELL